MVSLLRFHLLAAACAALPALALAHAPDEGPAVEGKRPPSIHARTSPPADAGKPPVFVLSSSGARDCKSRRADLAAHMAFKNQKMVWNVLRIASVGGSYRIKACRAAEEGFDKAVGLSDKKGSGRAFERASAQAFSKASACRRAFDALFDSECTGAQDGECKTADAEKREVDYLDEQSGRFAQDLQARKGQLDKLARCVESAAEDGEEGPDSPNRARTAARARPSPQAPSLAAAGSAFAAAGTKPGIIPTVGTPRTLPSDFKIPTPPETGPKKSWWDGVKDFGKGLKDKLAATGKAVIDAARGLAAEAKKKLAGAEKKPAALKEGGMPPLDDAMSIVQKSKTLVSTVEKLQKDNYRIEYGVLGETMGGFKYTGGTYVSKGEKIIVVDPAERGDAMGLSTSLAHEIGHAQYVNHQKYTPPDGLTKEQYVLANIKDPLADEGEATVYSVDVKRELLSNGVNGFTVAGAQAAEYEKLYDRYAHNPGYCQFVGSLGSGAYRAVVGVQDFLGIHDCNGKPQGEDREKLRDEVGRLFATGEHVSTPDENGNHKTYMEHYGQYYMDLYDELEASKKADGEATAGQGPDGR